MKIETKFNLDDFICPISYDKKTKKWFVEPYFLDLTVKDILICKSGIYYSTEYKPFAEKDCFETEMKAQKECERRNGK